MSRPAVTSGRRDFALDLRGALFVLGKGGVGKTTLSSGLAALAVKQGMRTLLVRLGETLDGSERRYPAPEPSEHGFDVVDLEPRHAMDEYVGKVVRVRPLIERITGSEVYRKFFAAAPGLPELVLLGRLQAFAQQRRSGDETRWHSIIVDCPSSGHGLLMLETPFAAFRAVSIGPFARLAGQIIDWIRSDVRVALVAIPEEMAVVEAVEFAGDLRERTGLSPSMAFLNRIRQDELSGEARRAVSNVMAPAGSSDRALIDCANRVHRRSRLEAFHLRRFASGLGLKPVLIDEVADSRPAAVASFLASRGK